MDQSTKIFKTKKLIIEIDQSKCISCGTCMGIAPNTFEFDKNLLSTVKENSDDDYELILEAAKFCSGAAINVKKIENAD